MAKRPRDSPIREIIKVGGMKCASIPTSFLKKNNINVGDEIDWSKSHLKVVGSTTKQ